ncbi:MAG: hypothetical protein NC228_11030 [[Eubacterium] siraeum]|nr:hypothetical protein [[Eubacterium] siraeum]
MNIKKIIAGAAASVFTAGALAASAYAADAVTFSDGTGKATLGDSSKGENTRITFDLTTALPAGINIADVYGVQLSFEGEFAEETGAGGTFIFSTKSNNWNGVEWGNEGADKAITYNAANKTLTRTETAPFFTATDISGNEGEYAQVVVDAYWGSGELKVTKISFLGQNGNELTASAASTTDATASAAQTTAAPTTTAAAAADKGNAATGVEGVAATAAVAVLAGFAVIAAKKRK